MVPTDTCAYGPVPEADQILNESRLLQVWPIAHKAERRRRSRVELRRIGDYIGEALVQEDVVRLYTDLPLLPAAVNGNRSFEISFGKAVALECDDGRGQQIRRQAVRIVANHPSKVAYNVGREQMLIRNDSHVLVDVAVLPLTGGLLHLFIRYVEVRQFVAEHQAQAVVRCEIALVAGGKIPRRPIVRVILRNGRTQITTGHRAVGTHPESVLAGEVLKHGVAADGVETTSRKDNLTVET